jgi:hypothetical protein
MTQERGRQSRADAKKRKAKARAEHAAKNRSWVDKPRHVRMGYASQPMVRATSALSLAAMERMIASWERQS